MSRIFQKLIKNTFIVSLGTFSSRVLGFVRDILIAKFFGTGSVIEAFFVAFSIPNMFRALVGEGAADSVVVPVISEYVHDKPKKEFYDTCSSIVVVSSILLLCLTVLGVVFSGFLVKVIAFGFSKDPGKFSFTVNLTQLIFPYLLFICLGAIIGGVLFVLKKFFAPAFSPIILNIVLILILLILPFYPYNNPIPLLAIGVLLSGLLQFFAHYISLVRSGFIFNWHLRQAIRHPVVSKMWRLFIPRLWGASVYHLNLLIDRALATLFWIVGTGGVAAVYYSNRLIQLPLAVFGLSVSRAVLPDLSSLHNQGNSSEYKSTLSFSFANLAFFLVPASVGLAFLASPIVEVIYKRGAFDEYSLSITSWALLFYSLGLFFFAGIRLLVNCFYSLQDTATPAKTASYTLGVNIILSVILMGPMKIGGLALASSIAAAFNFFVLYLALHHRLGGLENRKIWLNFFKILASSLAMGTIIWLLWNNLTLQPKIVKLIMVILLGFISFLITSFIFKVEHSRQFLKWLLKK